MVLGIYFVGGAPNTQTAKGVLINQNEVNELRHGAPPTKYTPDTIVYIAAGVYPHLSQAGTHLANPGHASMRAGMYVIYFTRLEPGAPA
jgi:hypothetical protein